jgi:putative DNA primase/helicase
MEELLAGFRTELSGLLNLALAALRQNKVETPESVKRASQHYRDSNSILKAFVEECVVRQSGARTHAAIMYSFYRNWCERNGHQAMASRRFGALISKRFGFEKLPDKRHWEGVAMLCPRGEDTTTYKPDVF